MAIKVKQSGAYADVVGVFAKAGGTYSAVQGIYAKSGDAYGLVFSGQAYPAQFFVNLSNPTGGMTIADSQAVVTIQNNPTATNLVDALALTYAGGSIRGTGGVTTSATVNRSSGVAPLTVRVDCTGTTSTEVSSAFGEVYYVVHYGDDLGEGYVYGRGAKKSVTMGGPVSGHIYERHGTYTLKVTPVTVKSDGTFKCGLTLSQTITVQDPNTTISQADTYWIDNGATPVPGVNGVPSDAVNCSNVTTWAGVGALLTAGKRVMGKRGAFWETTAGVSTVGDSGYLGAYGTGANPYVKLKTGTPSTTAAITNTSSSGWRFVDWDFTADAGLVAPRPIMGGPNFTALRCNVSGMWVGISPTPGSGVGDCNFTDFENSSNTNGGCGVFIGEATDFVLVGSNMSNCQTIEHCCRIQGGSKAFVQSNTMEYPKATGDKHAFTLRGYSVGGVWSGIYSEDMVVSDNIFRGTATTLTQFAPQNLTSDERIRRIIFERNFLEPTSSAFNTTCTQAYVINDFWCRSNIYKLSSSRDFAIRFSASSSVSGMPTITNGYVYGNSFYSAAGAVGYSALTTSIGGTVTTPVSGIASKNNVAYFPNAIASGTGAGTQGTYIAKGAVGITSTNDSTDSQVKNNNPFQATPTSDPTTWALNPASYAATNTLFSPTFVDYMLTTTPGIGNKIGAVQ